MSQNQANLYPAVDPKKSQPMPAYMHVQQQPDHWVESQKTPLLNGVPHYAIYNPKRAIVYAQKSRSNCCCVVGCVVCTLCCFTFFLIALVLGGIVAAYAVQCGKVASDQATFTSSLANITQLQFVNYNGPISLTSSSDATNVTITVTRRAANQDEIGRFISIFTVQNGQLYFEEQLPGKNNFWEAIINCVSSQIDITFPEKFANPLSLSVSSQNGDITVSILPGFSSATLTTTNGDMTLNLTAGFISATTVNGKVKLPYLISNSIIAKTTNGDIESDGGIVLTGGNDTTSNFQASTTNGDIDISSLSASSTANIDMTTTNGDITSTISKFAGSFDFQTTNGDITVNGDVHFTSQEKKEKQGTVKTGTSTFDVSTTNGDITITFA